MGQIKDFNQEEIGKLKKLIQEETGFDLESYKDDFLKRRFLPRAQLLGFDTLGDYVDFLKKNQKEKEIAKKKIFISTTEFFRNREVFEKLKEILVTDFKERNIVKAASAPCSTGEESFSIAMVLEEAEKDYIIYSIDGNQNVLKSMKNRKFSSKNLSPLYKNEIKRYFNEEGNLFSLKEDIMSRIFPIQADLTKNLPIKGLDIIFMRNFFIYLKEKTFLKCIENVERALNKGGLLVLGKVERVELDKTIWETVDLNLKIFRFKGGMK